MNDTITLPSFGPKTAFFDMNYTFIRMPPAHFQSVMNFIMQNKVCTRLSQASDSLYTCQCRNFYDCEFPRLRLHTADGFNISLNSSQYIVYDYSTLQCVIQIIPDHANLDGGAWRLG